jgi:hypothetical protein
LKTPKIIALCVAVSLFSMNTVASSSNSSAVDVQSVQQNRRPISGVVVDGNNDPLPGVTVMVPSRQGGVITDVDGAYTIEAATGEELRFQFLGMKTVTIEVGSGTIYNVQLLEDVEMLDEVTVTAFATQKKESVVSSIETISPSELKVPSSNLTTALAGRLAGVISYQRSGEPGADNAQFFVRGVTTFGYASSPLLRIKGCYLGSSLRIKGC